MEQIKKAFIVNCVLMSICVILMAYTAATFKAIYEILHSSDSSLGSVIASIFLLIFFFLAALATGIMGAIQVSIASRNLVKVRKWYTILLFALSCIFVIAPIVLVFLVVL